MQDIPVAIVTSDEARERDALAIASGISSRELMRNAGQAAALIIRKRLRDLVPGGVEVHVGPGNNGGDGWVVAAELARHGIPVRVAESESPRSPDAIAAKSEAAGKGFPVFAGNAVIVVDALLGTGSKGAPTGRIADAVAAIRHASEQGATVVALDIPTGLDATTGEYSKAVSADLTLSFGTLKRGHLISRVLCGSVEVLDIGLGKFGMSSDSDIMLASSDWVAAHVRPLRADAHKGTRKRLAIIAGDVGMAGAAILAGKGALRSGIGLLHLIVARENRGAVHSAIPAALVSTHDELFADARTVLASADALVIGPGLTSVTASKVLEAVADFPRPVVLDAGSLSALGSDRSTATRFCGHRETVLTPHPGEMARLIGSTTDDVLANRFEVGAAYARATGATVLLKGTPTVVSSAAGNRMASATGTPALATGGSGDMLSGIVGTLLAQTGNGFESAVSGAWVHGRAAELCGQSRGVTLEDILFAMPAAWKISVNRAPPVLAFLPVVK